MRDPLSSSDQIAGELANPPARELAKSFLAGAMAGRPDWEIISQLCRQAFFDPAHGQAATKAIFQQVIEKLCDRFTDQAVELCNQVLTTILEFIRHTPEGRELDRRLVEFGFASQNDILAHYQRIRAVRPIPRPARQAVKKIIILSRITAGADIAITSVIVQRLARSFPAAELVLIGPSHLPPMFADLPNSRFINFLYKNDGTLFDKMTSWPRLLAIVRNEQLGLCPGEILLFDPDTRLTQLGLLPILDHESTSYFCSRADVPPALEDKNLSFLTNHWLNLLLGEDLYLAPALAGHVNSMAFRQFRHHLKLRGCRRIICINFGVGNDPRKKIPGNFEENLIKTLLQDRQTVIILDSGRGPQESKHVEHHLLLARQEQIATAFLAGEEVGADAAKLAHGLIVFKAPLDSLAEMISAADCFIGYDSCGQHLASATGTPSVIIFAGAPSPRFIRRWSPATLTTTIPVDKELTSDSPKIDRLVTQVGNAVRQIQAKGESLADH